MVYLWTQIERWGSFPEEVNNRAARLVAAGVALLAAVAVTVEPAITLLLFVGFLLRAWRGPQLDPLAKGAVWLAPRLLGKEEVPGAPKRFAQILGLLLTACSSALYLLGAVFAAQALLLLLLLLASLEALGGFCLGCKIFASLIERGWLPAEVCERCRNFSA